MWINPFEESVKKFEKRQRAWDVYLMGFAVHAATKSKDSTKVGAVLVGGAHDVRLTSFNGPPIGVYDTPDRFERPLKYLYAAHAEANLIAFAARAGIVTDGCTVYCTHAPCSSCARSMIQAGIKHLVHGNGVFNGMEPEVAASRMMFAETGGTFRQFECEDVSSTIPLNMSPMSEGSCLCGAKPKQKCRHPNEQCSSLNHPIIRKNMQTM